MDTASTSSFNSSVSESDSIKIFLRVRPPEISISENDFAPRVLEVNTADNAVILKTKPDPKIFTYDNVADADITQEAVFSTVGKKIIESCVAGYNGTIFAYGQTGSGKTFTMLGPSENSDNFQHELRGVIPRSFEYLFSLIAHQQELHGSRKQFLCRCSFLEIYQEQIFDLLDTASQGLHLRENMNKGVFVDGLIEQVICNPTDAYQVLVVGMLNRRVAGTSMNRESSRSHAVFTVTIESKEEIDGIQNIRTSQLNLVDLAGSERQRDTNTGGTRLKEAGSINKSLSVLGNVIMSLVDISHGKKRHIPYRDSKLTFLLRDSLGGNTKTRMIACVHPDSRCFGETLSTLNFARSAKLIKNKAVVNEDFHGNNQKLQNEIRRLKEIVESLQSNSISPSSALDKQALLNAESAWKTNFIDAMYFREQTESEKKALQDVVNHLQELCNKKDKYIQSTKMIIKFRESTIQTLRQSAESGLCDLEKDSLVKSLRDEIRVLRQQLENNPMLAKLAGENKHLRSELKRLRARDSLGDVHSTASKVADLESIFKELKLYKELSTGSPRGVLRGQHLKDGMTPEASEKYKRECKEYQEQIEKLRHQVLDVTKTAESRQIAMEVELVSRQKTIKELERVLEAHQLKARIECNALKDLHCQTLKVMTTPKMSGNSPGNSNKQSPGNVSSDFDGETLDCMLPKDLAAGAHDALMEEIHMLQMENGKLKERVDEYESDLLRQRQQVEKLELFNTQIMEVLDKERSENTARRNDYTNAVNTLNEEIDTVKNDLKLLNEENTDLHLVLKSADKQLREEKEKQKATLTKFAQESQALESKILKSNIDLERTTRDYEEALKELGSVKEELEMGRVTISFIESHALELEALRSQEIKKREKLEQEYKALQSSSGDYQEYKNQAQANLDLKEAQLEKCLAEIAEQGTLIEQKDRAIQENKDMISTLMGRVNEMKQQHSELEESRMSLKAEVDNYSQELEEARRELEEAVHRVELLQAQHDEVQETSKLELQRKEFEINNVQEDYKSVENMNMKQKDKISKLEADIKGKELRIMELAAVENELKERLNISEQAKKEMKLRYDDSLRQFTLREACDKQNKLLAQFENAQIELKKENDKLKTRTSEIEKTKEELEEKKFQIEDLQMQEQEKKEFINSLKTSLSEKEDQVLQMQKINSNLNESFSTMQQEFHSVNERLESIESEKKHFQQEVQR
ncbi:kinesin-like protein KIF15 [Elysia marginata]|uniref:Kinesin-like protein KIF15 n=1 Tax=Elysia marginata TaxID=1093978 RepID=A0AAV4ICL5_9GAST|nr:kinesin-like protein KIF15 [Elysia marginata]